MTDERERLLLAYDGSPNAATAVRAAASLFPDARACVVTVPDDPLTRAHAAFATLTDTSGVIVADTIDQLGDEARRQAGETAAQGVEQARALGLDADVASVAPTAPAWPALLDAAHRLDAAVIVSGTRGRGAFTRALLGSTSSSLLHNTDVPLLLVPDGGGALDGPVVVAYDGSDGAKRAIEAVGRLFRGRAVVVHAWEPVSQRALAGGRVDELSALVVRLHEALADAAATTTEEGVALARAAGLDAAGDTVEADDGAWRAVAGAARAHGAAVIATGARGLGAARSVLLGSVSSSLIQNAELPVLVVPVEP
jgi:nucleotide-binding universal stress UspA family protein